MSDKDLRAELADALDDALGLARARDAEIQRLAEQRVQTLVTAAAGWKRSKATARFGWFLLVVCPFIVAVAIYMLVDGRQRDSLFVLMSALIPLLAGGWFLHRADVATKRWATELTRMQANTDWMAD